MKFILFAFAPLFLTFNFALLTSVHAIYDPLSVPNNKFGIHIITASKDEASPAASLVNSSGGDWGYLTVLLESKDKDYQKWQNFFNDLRRRHLIPIVRLATQPEGASWKRPNPGEEESIADFLNQLIWPTKNRYVVIYNEPNHAKEWGNQIDAQNYAQTLDKTIVALKKRSEDFFVLNAGFDASAPNKLPAYQDQLEFMTQMNQAVPGIFSKLDGWVSHSYPNPGFIGSPQGYGRGSVRTWYWELQQLRNLGVSKNLPVFISETGWKHSEGMTKDRSLPSPETVGEYFKAAFSGAWASERVVAVTPFLLNYQESPFDHFSFKKLTGEAQSQKILPAGRQVLGAQYPEYYPHYQIVQEIRKVTGRPIQEYTAQLTKGQIYSSMVVGESYIIPLTFKNSGQAIWGEDGKTSLHATSGGRELGMVPVVVDENTRVEPGQDYTANVKLQAPQSGSFPVELQLYHRSQPFDSPSFKFSTEVKSPVILQVKTSLAWKNNFSGDYLLKVAGVVSDVISKLQLNTLGHSGEVEARHLLPDYTFDFTLERPYYLSKTIHQSVHAGVNKLDFGELQPDLARALLHPLELWRLLPWSE